MHLERYVVVSDTDLELLLADDVLLGPVRVVLPVRRTFSLASTQTTLSSNDSLRDLARLDDALQLLHDGRPNPHFVQKKSRQRFLSTTGQHHALSFLMRLSFL